MLNDDMALVRAYAHGNSEPAFTELVARHVNLVYSVALRQVREPGLAQEVTQAVFIILARKAASLGDRTVVVGWLCRTARYASADALKRERRRQRREQAVYMQSANPEPGPDLWPHIAPLLDDALAHLGEQDHNAIVLRYLENKKLSDVGQALGTNEAAAKMRVSRALEKLRKFFAKRGITLSAAVIAGAVSANSVQAAPAGLAATISALALTKGATAGGSTTTLVKGTLKLMAWTKAKLAIVVGVGVLLAAGTTTVVVEKVLPPTVDESFWAVTFENLDRAPAVVIIRPAHYTDNTAASNDDGRVLAHNMSFIALLEAAYSIKPLRMILPPDYPQGQYELMLTLRDHPQEALQNALHRQFGIVCRREIRDTNVLWLAVREPGLLARHVSRGGRMHYQPTGEITGGTRSWVNSPIASVADYLEGEAFNRPVVVQAGLDDRYDITFQADPADGAPAQNIQVRSQQAAVQGLARAGLELVPTNLPIEMLVVERVK